MTLKNVANCKHGPFGRAMVSLSVAALITFACARADADATVHFAFDETGGNTASDSVGNLVGDLGTGGTKASLGDPIGALPTFVPGRFGNALYVDGVGVNNDTPGLKVRTGDFSGLNFGTASDFTIAYWLKSDPAYSYISAETILSPLYGPGGTFSGDRFQFSATRSAGFNGHYQRYGPSPTVTTSPPATVEFQPGVPVNIEELVVDDTWHHYAFSVDRDGDTVYYIDAVEVVRATADNTAIDFVGATGINVMGDQFNGSIDELRFGNDALSAANVGVLFRDNVWVPEPATTVLLAVGLLALLGIRRR